MPAFLGGLGCLSPPGEFGLTIEDMDQLRSSSSLLELIINPTCLITLYGHVPLLLIPVYHDNCRMSAAYTELCAS